MNWRNLISCFMNVSLKPPRELASPNPGGSQARETMMAAVKQRLWAKARRLPGTWFSFPICLDRNQKLLTLDYSLCGALIRPSYSPQLCEVDTRSAKRKVKFRDVIKCFKATLSE